MTEPSELRVIVVGLGVQGHKRRRWAGSDVVAVVDPLSAEANYTHIEQVPIDSYDAALVCTPDDPKHGIATYLLTNGKHMLVEKPLFLTDIAEFDALEALANAHSAVLYTAYNHRFEPHFMRMKQLFDSGKLGKIYHIRLFYGNGTARLVRDSQWRDQGGGVIPDLASHLLDTLTFWLGETPPDFNIVSANCFENRAFDHAVMTSLGDIAIECEMTLLSWRNHFTADIYAEAGSAHIQSLCKWGPSKMTIRKRVLPSGRPPEDSVELVQDDPTWQAEYQHFKGLCSTPETSCRQDRWIQQQINHLVTSAEASRGAS